MLSTSTTTLRVLGADALDQLQPAHARHRQVDDGQADALPAQAFQRLEAAAGFDDLPMVGHRLEDAAQPLAHDGVVVDQQQARAVARFGRAHGLPLAVAPAAWRAPAARSGARAPAGGCAARSGRRTVTRPPPPRRVADLQFAAEHQRAFADAQQAVRAFAEHRGRVEAHAVVLHRQQQLAAAFAAPRCRPRWRGRGGRCWSGPPAPCGTARCCAASSMAGSAAPSCSAHLHAHAPRPARRPAIRWPRSGPGRRASAAAVRWRCGAPWRRCRRPSPASRRCGAARRACGLAVQAGQLHLQRGQPLAQFVVQLARDAPALVLARLHHARRQAPQVAPRALQLAASRARAR